MRAGQVRAAWTPAFGGVAEGVLKMCLGNHLGFTYAAGLDQRALFDYAYGSFVMELTPEAPAVGTLLGQITAEPAISPATA